MPVNTSRRHRQRLGQIFLRDPLVVEKILQQAALAPHETVLEIGPGRGALTTALAQHAAALYAIEIDAPYADLIRQRFAAMPHVHVLQADARTYDYEQLPTPLVVVANLPYSMGMAILTHLLQARHRLSRLIVMLQKEVAQRLLAVPGSSAYSTLSIFVQYYAVVQHGFEVSRQAFTPVPAVESTVLELVPFAVPPYASQDEALFFRVVHSAFAHRRKVLRSNLFNMPELTLSREQLAAIFVKLGLGDNIRAQDLHLSQFVALAEALRLSQVGL